MKIRLASWHRLFAALGQLAWTHKTPSASLGQPRAQAIKKAEASLLEAAHDLVHGPAPQTPILVDVSAQVESVRIGFSAEDVRDYPLEPTEIAAQNTDGLMSAQQVGDIILQEVGEVTVAERGPASGVTAYDVGSSQVRLIWVVDDGQSITPVTDEEDLRASLRQDPNQD